MTKRRHTLRFLQLMPNTPTNGNFLLRDLPGSGKRIDILCRDAAACFDWGPVSWPKSCLELVGILSDAATLTFQYPGTSIPKGETEWAHVMLDSLTGRPPVFVHVSEGGAEQSVRQLMSISGSQVWLLDRGGVPLADLVDAMGPAQNSFMLGDHRGIDQKTRQLANECGVCSVSVGNTSYLSSHCVAAVISEFERLGL